MRLTERDLLVNAQLMIALVKINCSESRQYHNPDLATNPWTTSLFQHRLTKRIKSKNTFEISDKIYEKVQLVGLPISWGPIQLPIHMIHGWITRLSIDCAKVKILPQ